MTPPPLPVDSGELAIPVPKRSTLAVVAFCFAAPAVPVALVFSVLLFQKIWENPGPESGPLLLGLLSTTLLGFIAAILGAVSLRRLRGPRPELRGRALASFAVFGSRAVLLAGALGFGAIWLGGLVRANAGEDVESERIVLGLWILALVLVLGYLRAGTRRTRRDPRGNGWGLFTGGVLFHLLLLFALPASMVGAFVALHQPQFQVGQDPGNHPPMVFHGTYAARDLWIDLPANSTSRIILRRWEHGKSSTLGTLSVSGTNRVRWMLADAGGSGTHTLTWSLADDTKSAQVHSFKSAESITLVPKDLSPSVSVPPGGRTNFWLFVPIESARAGSLDSPPEEGFELALEPAPSGR